MNERGASALVLAAAIVFLLGAAALAVDVSGFYQTAASEQRAADLGCLAGSVELPGDPATAFQEAASFVRPNHPQLSGIDPTNPTQTVAAAPPTTGEIRRWTAGNTTLEIETPVLYNSTYSETTLRVSIIQDDDTAFGRVVGADSVNVSQEAYCGVFSSLPAGIFPVGVTGGFGGGVVKFDDSQCGDEASTASGSGVCNYLEIPRDTFSFGGTTDLTYNIMLGSDWPLTCYHPTGAGGCLSTIVDCDPGDPTLDCNRLTSKSGNVPNALYTGLIGGRTSTNHLGLLAYSAGSIGSPVNPHQAPPAGTSSIARPSSPTSLIDWNTNYITNSGLHSVACSPGSGNLYYDTAFPGGPAEPTSTCDASDIDDQPVYSPTAPTVYEYKTPPSFAISQYDCRDRRLIVLPAGTWGPVAAGPSNPRAFTITGFELGYIVDPIYEDEGGTAGIVDSSDYTTPDNRMLQWEDGPAGSGSWDTVSATATSVEQMSILSVSFTGDATITGDCELTPFDPALEGLVPKQLSLVDAP